MRIWTILLSLILACFVTVNIGSAQEKKKHDRPSPEQRFDNLEKAVKHDPLTGELTKDEFVTAMKETKSRQADKAGEIFGQIKKASDTKVTKAEYVAFVKEHFQHHKKSQ
jgi:hypothetical protein